jgi:hypothetical protein
MSISVGAFRPNYFGIQSLDGKNKVDVTNSLLSFDYFEDLLSPCITAIVQIVNSSSLFNILPIRGGEKVAISIDTAFGEFLLDGDDALYVTKVSGLDAQTSNENFTLHMVSREGLTNETVRCEKKYNSATIDVHVKSILKDTLKTKKFNSQNIETTSNNYSFIGNNKKPFHILTWLGPKSVPATSSRSGTSGEGEYANAKGTAGYLFYENKDGFNFRSIDSLVANTQIQNQSANKEKIITYIYTQVIENNTQSNELKILNYEFEKNIDLMKSLRVGMYSNKSYFYDLYSNSLDIYKYTLKEEIGNKLGNKDIAVSDEFGDSISRIMVRVSDRGALNSNGTVSDKERSGADMAKSYSRYNILFTQALNMVVPCNVSLKVGSIINVIFPKIDTKENKESDDEQSGNYLIKGLRHHFEGGQMVTSLRLIRDSYGLYGPNNIF